MILIYNTHTTHHPTQGFTGRLMKPTEQATDIDTVVPGSVNTVVMVVVVVACVQIVKANLDLSSSLPRTIARDCW